MPAHDCSAAYASTTSAFTINPSLYPAPPTNNQSPEPEGIAGPGPQTMHYHQQAAEPGNSKILEEE